MFSDVRLSYRWSFPESWPAIHCIFFYFRTRLTALRIPRLLDGVLMENLSLVGRGTPLLLGRQSLTLLKQCRPTLNMIGDLFSEVDDIGV